MTSTGWVEAYLISGSSFMTASPSKRGFYPSCGPMPMPARVVGFLRVDSARPSARLRFVADSPKVERPFSHKVRANMHELLQVRPKESPPLDPDFRPAFL